LGVPFLISLILTEEITKMKNEKEILKQELARVKVRNFYYFHQTREREREK
jgi:hypothetical protein